MSIFIIKLITLYQQTLSPDTGWFKGRFFGGYCKFTPHCSEYCKQVIEKYGVICGGGRSIFRVLRCNPWSKGGMDAVK